MASTITMFTWVLRSYKHRYSGEFLEVLDVLSCTYVMLFYVYNYVRYCDTITYLWNPGPLIDGVHPVTRYVSYSQFDSLYMYACVHTIEFSLLAWAKSILSWRRQDMDKLWVLAGI